MRAIMVILGLLCLANAADAQTLIPHRETDLSYLTNDGHGNLFFDALYAAWDGGLELHVTNLSPGRAALAELGVTNDVGGRCDMAITGSGFNDGSNAGPNEGLFVCESTVRGLHFRSNSDYPIRYSVGYGPVDYLQIQARAGVTIMPNDYCPSYAPAGGGFALCVDRSGNLWAVSDHGSRRLFP